MSGDLKPFITATWIPEVIQRFWFILYTWYNKYHRRFIPTVYAHENKKAVGFKLSYESASGVHKWLGLTHVGPMVQIESKPYGSGGAQGGWAQRCGVSESVKSRPSPLGCAIHWYKWTDAAPFCGSRLKWFRLYTLAYPLANISLILSFAGFNYLFLDLV